MNNFDFDDDLPFSPAYEDDDNNKEKENKENESKVSSEDVLNFLSNENVKEEIKDDSIKEESLNVNLENNTEDNYQDSNPFINNDLNKADNEINIPDHNENLNKEDLFSLNLDDSDENIKAKDLFKPDVKEEPKKKKAYKNTKEYTEFVKKTSRVLPVVAFLFVSLIGVYVFVNKANADSINLIKIEENSKTGYIDNSGEVIVKPKYLYGTDFYKGYAVVKNYNSLYGIIDGKGKNKIAFGNIFSATLYGNRYAVSKFTNEGLKMGLMNENLEELTRFKYDNIT